MNEHTNLPQMFDYNVQADRVHKANEKWWLDINTGERKKRNIGTMCMLIITELAEGTEGWRKNLMDDHLPHRKSIEVELADARIRILDILGDVRRHTNGALDINEAIEVIRQGKNADAAPSPEMAEDFLEIVGHVVDAYRSVAEDTVGTGFSVALECFIVALDTIEVVAKWHGCDLEGAYEEKMAYNAVREDHTLEARRAEHGKKV